MKNSKVTKRALFSSVMSSSLCVSMLIGTTFAWFTDSVETGVNKIQSGTLAIDLIHENGGVDNQDVSIKANSGHKIFNYDRWEPGYTQVETLTIANKGSLALQYALNATISGAATGNNGEKLSDVIDVYMSFGENTPTSVEDLSDSSKWWPIGTLTDWLDGENLTSGKMLPEGAEGANLSEGITSGSCTVTVALHMREDAGNEYQNLSVGDVTLTLNATQWTYEKDSFGDKYDSNEKIISLSNGLKVSYNGSMLYSVGEFNGTGITSNDIPDSVTVINNRAFSGNQNIETIDLKDTNIKVIGNRAFKEAKVTSINLPDTLTTIMEGAFQQSSLTGEVKIPQSVTKIGENAFYEATGITAINIPDGITTINKNAFRAISIEEIRIPNSVTSIGDYAFRDCKSLKTIHYGGTKEQWESITFGSGWKLHAQNPYDLIVECKDGTITLSREN